VRVHLISDDARVELRRSAAKLAEPVCRAPCGAEVEFRPDEKFKLGGPGLSDSEEFSIRPRDSDLTLRVIARSQTPRTVGKVLVIGGGIAIGLAEAISYAGLLCAVQEGCSTNQGVIAPLVYGGIAAALVGGIVLLASQSTQYTVKP
jgi:hypothetical protein